MISEDLKKDLLSIESKSRGSFINFFVMRDLIDKIIESDNINVVSKANATLLHYLTVQTSNEHLTLLSRKLLEHGINIDAIDCEGKTALMYAVILHNVEMVKLLLEYNANFIIINNKENTALDYARENGEQEIINLLEDAYKKGKYKSIEGDLRNMLVTVPGTHWDFIQKVLKTDNINLQDVHGETLLHYYMEPGNEYIVRLLLEHGINPNIKNDADYSPYSIARINGYKEFLDMFKEFDYVNIDYLLEDKIEEEFKLALSI